MHYDVVIIGAGMSGLAAGIRLAHFDKRVIILERHYAFGGLNSYYKLHGREFDVGLHALTNYVPPGVRSAPLPKLLRQLRINREELQLCEQYHSEIQFPSCTLRFTNDIDVLVSEIDRAFPDQVDGFGRLLSDIRDYDDTRLDQPYRSARRILAEYLNDRARIIATLGPETPRGLKPAARLRNGNTHADLGNSLLVEMLLCPIMYYGSAQERDMDFTQFVTLFKSIFCEGFARPRGGVRTIVKALVKRYRSCGGKLKTRCGVKQIHVDKEHAAALTLDNGETLTADMILSGAGYPETMQLCANGPARCFGADSKATGLVGQLSFVESMAVLDCPPVELGHETTIVFFNDADQFEYAKPDVPIDTRSGVACCPNNYEDHDDESEGLFRLTWLANHERWMSLNEEAYTAQKAAYYEDFLKRSETFIPTIRDHVVCTDMFTPRTIRHYTGHLNGSVYGMPRKRRDGRTPIDNLFICGTDQGFLGIIGAILSGITIANLHVLSKG